MSLITALVLLACGDPSTYGALESKRWMVLFADSEGGFWVDPDSPYYKDIFGSEKEFYFYCASAWRSALATHTVQEMGLEPVADIEGGFSGWKKAGGPVGEKPVKRSKT